MGANIDIVALQILVHLSTGWATSMVHQLLIDFIHGNHVRTNLFRVDARKFFQNEFIDVIISFFGIERKGV